jgi:hypothetical protein
MLKLLALVGGIALLQVGCDDDEDDGQIGGEVFPDAPGTPEQPGTMFQVLLTPAEEVPACAASGFYATGAATVTISADESRVTVSGLRYSELSGPATGAHIHAGPAGVAGPIVFDMSRELPPPAGLMLTFTQANYPSPAPAGAPADYASFIADMKAGISYVNVHTALCPAGEIRGQLR